MKVVFKLLFKVISFLFIVSCCPLSSLSILDYCSTDYSHRPAEGLNVDAVFIYSVTGATGFERINEECFDQGITPTFIDAYDHRHLPKEIVEKFCSQNVSPYLLAEILSHLSIYQYCLRHGLNKILILHSNASFVDETVKLNEILGELDKIDSHWDLCFTDVDYHNPQNGDLITPAITVRGKIAPNKKELSANLSQLMYRYGCYAFAISESGMRKTVRAFQQKWPNLPYDQALLKTPGLRAYTSNRDIITNYHAPKITNPYDHISEECFKNPRKYPLGASLWIEPSELLSPSSFHAVAKYIYAKYSLSQYETQWHISLYKEHLKKWNNFYEGEPLKVGFKDFQGAFQELLADLQVHSFDGSRGIIPITSYGTIINGSHRLGACLAMNLPLKVEVTKQGSNKLFRSFAYTMRDQHQVDTQFIDQMAIEYAALKENTFIVCLFPCAYSHHDLVDKLLDQYGDCIYSKDISFNQTGALELIRLIYYGEKWVGTYQNRFSQGRVKRDLCFPKKTYNNTPMRVYLFQCDDLEKIKEVKQKIRKLIQLGNDSIHINDTHEQTMLIARSVFHDNSIRFMNKKKIANLANFERLFVDLKTYLREEKIDPTQVCVDGSGVLSAYGLRDCRDIDLLNKVALPRSRFEIDSHNGYLKYHAKPLDDILFNPNSYFYYQGIKFLEPGLLKIMKSNRAEPKDIVDVNLINTL